MPPQYASSSSGSDNESVIEAVPKPRGGARKATSPVKITSDSDDAPDDVGSDAGSDAGSDDGGDEEEYIVEKILDHKFNGKVCATRPPRARVRSLIATSGTATAGEVEGIREEGRPHLGAGIKLPVRCGFLPPHPAAAAAMLMKLKRCT